MFQVQLMNGAWRVFTPTPVAFAGRVSQWGLAVSRAFGDLPLKDPMKLLSVVPETKVFVLDEDCIEVIFACDGIWDVMTNEQCREIVMPGGSNPLSAKDTANAVTRASYGMSSEDNLTTLAVKLTFEPVGGGVNGKQTKRRRMSS